MKYFAFFQTVAYLVLLITSQSLLAQENDVIINPTSNNDDNATLLLSGDDEHRSGIGLRYSDQEQALQLLNWQFTSIPPFGGFSAYTTEPIIRFEKNGLIGIGTDSPNARLHINVPNGTVLPLRIQINNSSKFTIHENGGIVVGTYLNPISSNPPDNGMHIKGDITVGSNTKKAGYRLNVDGKIATEEVLVQNSIQWPDYVFADSYTLSSLESVKEFIALNHHLPEVPSAAEIDSNGIELGDMQAILLKKIEELTLYILQQEARIKSLERASK